MYYALYRKYRPIDFNSVVGQDSIVKTLKNSVKCQSFSHAYIFFGPRGIGKTSVSKIFARSINCDNPVDGNLCGSCPSCQESLSSECVDIIEIDAASNNGVDEIRELRNNVNLVPARLKYKVYIIDEVHMLSSGAFNALLKTLEEPPKHVVFILATTDPQKVPETIVSRCQCFSFNRVSELVLIDRLKYVCSSENIKVDDEVLKKIALLSEGGLRDALGLLDKMVAYSSDNITIDDFNDVNGIITDEEMSLFLHHIFDGNINNVLSNIQTFNELGKNIVQILVQLLNYVRDLIVDYYIKNSAMDFSLELLQLFANNLNEKLNDIKKSGNPKIYSEIFLLKFISDNVVNKSKMVYEKSNSDNNNINITTTTTTNNNNNNSVSVEENKSSSVSFDDNIDGKKNVFDKDVEFSDTSLESKNISSSQVHKIININEVMSARINNTMATADKQLLKNELLLFDKLTEFSFDSEVGAIVNSILDSKIRACGKNNFIISYSSDASVDQNLENIELLDKIYNKITNSNKKIAIVSDSKWDSIKNDYIKRLKEKIGYEIMDEPDFIIEETENNDIIGSSAISLFGEDIVEFE